MADMRASQTERGFFGGLWHDLNRSIGRGYRTVFLLSLCTGLLAEALAFMQVQAANVAAMLEKDFRVIVVLSPNADDQTTEKLKTYLPALKGVKSAVYINREESLRRFKMMEPEVAKSVVLFGSNPVPDFFELEMRSSVLSDIGGWVDANLNSVDGIDDVVYKPEQAVSVMHARFYQGFLRLILNLAALLLVAFGFFVELIAVRRQPVGPKLRRASGWMFSGVCGMLCAMGLCWALVYPLKHLNPLWWSFPAWQSNLVILVSGALIGWTLFRWQEPA